MLRGTAEAYSDTDPVFFQPVGQGGRPDDGGKPRLTARFGRGGFGDDEQTHQSAGSQ
jgi:hypothetical protein